MGFVCNYGSLVFFLTVTVKGARYCSGTTLAVIQLDRPIPAGYFVFWLFEEGWSDMLYGVNCIASYRNSTITCKVQRCF